MICKFKVKNFKAFSDETELVFFADRNIKRFDYNLASCETKSVLKTVGFYGPNNTGKTCILTSLACLRALMLNEQHENLANAFGGEKDITSFSVEYLIHGRFYVYNVEYNNRTRTYEKESLYRKTYQSPQGTKERIFERNANHLTWLGMTNDLKKANLLGLFSPYLPFMVVVSDLGSEEIGVARKDYFDFAQSIIFLKMDGPVDISKTIQLMQSDQKAARFVKEFVKNCDLHIDDFGFDDNVVSDANIDESLKEAMSNPAFIKETLKFYSKHNGYRVPSIFFDSVGTMKLIALSGYIYDALRNGKTLLIDEIDSSLHHIITKSIVAMFNNMLNKRSQLFFTTHDVLLLDLRELLRKDQVWLIDISDDRHGSQAVQMSERFTARAENGIRGDEDIAEYYLKGHFGSIPTPDLFASLEEAVSDE